MYVFQLKFYKFIINSKFAKIIIYILYYIIQNVSKMVQADKLYAKINRKKGIIFFYLKLYFQINQV